MQTFAKLLQLSSVIFQLLTRSCLHSTFASILGPRTGAKLADLRPPTININAGSAQTLGWAADPLYSAGLRRTGGAFQGPLSSLFRIVLTPQSDPRQWPVHVVGQPRSTVLPHLPLLSLFSVGMSDARHEQEYLVLVGHRTQTAPQIGRSSGYAIERLPLYDAGCGPAACGWHSYFEPRVVTCLGLGQATGFDSPVGTRLSTSSRSLSTYAAAPQTLGPSLSLPAIHRLSASLHATWRPLLLILLVPTPNG